MSNSNNIEELKYTIEHRELKINKLLNNITHQSDVISELEVENELLKATIDQINKTNETQG